MKKVLPPLIFSAIIVAVLKTLSLFSFTHSEIIYSAISTVLLILGSIFLKPFSEKKVRFIRFFKLRFAKSKDLSIIPWMTLTVISGSFFLNLLSFDLFTALGLDLSKNVMTSYDTNNLWLSVLTIALLPAIFEELFFRGAILSVLSNKKKASSIFISAALFALVHGSLYMIPSSFFAGIVLGITVYLTESIYTAMLVHFINNIMAYFLFAYSRVLSDAGFEESIMLATVLVFLISIYGAISVTAKRYKKELNSKSTIINEGERIWEERKGKRLSKKQ